MNHETITKGGKRFVLVPKREYDRLRKSAATATTLPAFPPVDQHGNANAAAFMRVSIARKLRAEREAAGLSQQALATAAGVRQETVSRIESGKHTPTVAVIDKLDAAIRRRKSK
jgi:ribosome-binding protein aMBF1 (putative translation factor)